MTLFLHLFPQSQYKKYFITIPSHVVAAIEIDGIRYVIDKGLPIFPLMNWMGLWKEKRNKKKLKAKIVEVTYINNIIKTKKINSEKITQTILPQIDTDKITKELMCNLNISPNQNKTHIVYTIPLRFLALKYDVNAITHFSFLEEIKLRIENEFYNLIHRISYIELVQNEKDLSLNIYYASSISYH
jgi:predicted transglutaminase-like protease